MKKKSKVHRDCFLMASKGDIVSRISGNQLSLHRQQVKIKRQVMERVVNAVNVCGKLGLSYRGSKSESAYTLEDNTIDHGNFLELILFQSRYDSCMQQHVTECIEKSKKQHEAGGKGRGSLVTLLSKDTLNKVITIISQLIKETVADEVRAAGMFSVQIDTTQDITSNDQCSVILRYVTDAIHERLVAVVDCKASTGQYFVELLKKILQKLNLDITLCMQCNGWCSQHAGPVQRFFCLSQ